MQDTNTGTIYQSYEFTVLRRPKKDSKLNKSLSTPDHTGAHTTAETGGKAVIEEINSVGKFRVSFISLIHRLSTRINLRLTSAREADKMEIKSYFSSSDEASHRGASGRTENRLTSERIEAVSAIIGLLGFELTNYGRGLIEERAKKENTDAEIALEIMIETVRHVIWLHEKGTVRYAPEAMFRKIALIKGWMQPFVESGQLSKSRLDDRILAMIRLVFAEKILDESPPEDRVAAYCTGEIWWSPDCNGAYFKSILRNH